MESSIFLQAIFIGSVITQPVLAQITPDNTTSTTVIPTATGVEINNGDVAGDNLFHSFDEFSVPTGSEAFFNNPSDISNIFSRVTGGNISNIDGILSANNANLFLINPAGILFGEAARLQLGGSFYGSTADSIVFPDGEFSATDSDNPPLITINAPIGLNFRDNPGDITIQGTGNGVRELNSPIIDTEEALRVGTDNTIGLIGGNIFFDNASIKTAGGRIEIGSVAGGQVDLVEVAKGFTFDYSAIENFSDISFARTSSIDASGLGGGDINVAANNISMTGVAGILSHTLGGNPSGDINIFAEESLTIDGDGSQNERGERLNSVIANRVYPDGTADGGNINIETGRLSLEDFAIIRTSTVGQGDAGDINITANDSISIGSKVSTSQIASSVGDLDRSEATGDGGDINLTTPSLSLEEGSFIFANAIGEGDAGNISILASSIELEGFEGGERNFPTRVVALVRPEATGNGGNITFGSEESPLETLRVVNDAQVSVNTFGRGNAGTLTIFANKIELDRAGSTSDTRLPIGLSAQVREEAVGSGGNITLGSEQSPVGTLKVVNGAEVSVNTFGQGNAGNLTIFAKDIELDRGEGGARILTAEVAGGATGNGGNITIGNEQSPASEFRLLNGGRVLVLTRGQGNAGKFSIFADAIEINNSRLVADVAVGGTGQGGKIDIGSEQFPVETFKVINGARVSVSTRDRGNAGEMNIFANNIELDRAGSEAQTGLLGSALDEAIGNGGDINIGSGESPVESLKIINGASVFVNTRGQGDAGNLTIFAKDIELDRGGDDFPFVAGLSAEVHPAAPGNAGVTGNGGSINIGSEQFPVESLSITNGAEISVSTYAKGNAGNLIIFAKNIELQGRGNELEFTGLYAEVLPGATGKGGDIILGSPQSPIDILRIADGAEISVNTGGQGDAGNITVNVSRLELSNKSQISVNNFVFKDIDVSQGGIDRFILDEPISGSGNAGVINITADNISLQDESGITAVSTSGEGGNVDLKVAELLSLRNNSEISTEAGQLNTPGNGGDINIDAELIFAFPDTNSDITANAFDGTGGNIKIISEGIIGIEARDLNDVTNDINADSQLGVSGNVSINSPDNNPLRETTEVSGEIVTKEIVSAANACTAKDIDDTSGLVINGKGGVPPEPTEPFDGLAIIDEGDVTATEKPSTYDKNTNNLDRDYISSNIKPVTHDKDGEPIYIARGLIVREDGGITLTPYPTPGTPGYREYQEQIGCDVP